MIELRIDRIEQNRSFTLGRLSFVNELGTTYFCDTLEPPVAAYNQVKRAVPAGRYPVAVTWDNKWQQWLPLVLGIPYRRDIRIHAGNKPADTEGSILVGQNLMKGQVLNSRKTLEALMQRLRQRPEGEGVFLVVG